MRRFSASFLVFGGSSGDESRSITTVDSGGVALAGYTHSYGDGYRDVWVVRVPEDYPPTWESPPSNQTILFDTSFNYTLKVTDQSEIDQWWINNTVEFTISDDGTISNRTSLGVGTYPLLIRVDDIWGNKVSALFHVHVVLPEPTLPILPPMWPAFIFALVIVFVLAAPFLVYSHLKKQETK